MGHLLPRFSPCATMICNYFRGGDADGKTGQSVVPAGQCRHSLFRPAKGGVFRHLPLLRPDDRVGAARRPAKRHCPGVAPVPQLCRPHPPGFILVLSGAKHRPGPLFEGRRGQSLPACALPGGQRLAGAVLLLPEPHLSGGVPRPVRRGRGPNLFQDAAGGVSAADRHKRSGRERRAGPGGTAPEGGAGGRLRPLCRAARPGSAADA